MKGFKQLIIFTLFLSAKLFACTTLNWQSNPTDIIVGAPSDPELCVNPIGNGVTAWVDDAVPGSEFVQASSL